MIIKLLSLCIWMIMVPFCIGAIPILIGKKKRDKFPLAFALSAGMLIMWAIFQLITVPFVLHSSNFRKIIRIYDGIYLVLVVIGIYLFWRKRQIIIDQIKIFMKEFRTKKPWQYIIWLIFLVSLLFQLYQSYTLAYADGDDAYYLPIAAAADLGGTMYVLDPYTGVPTTLDARHGLAPFPIWVAYIADKCNVNVAVAAHSLIPLILIPITYLLYYMLAKKLLQKKEVMIPIFLLFVSLLQVFGNYSIYPASTFLLTRTRQGKEALGNIVLLFLLFLFFEMGNWIKEKRYVEMIFWLFITGLAGCLCSTMASFLIAMGVVIAAFMLMITLRDEKTNQVQLIRRFNWKFMAASIIGCIPCIFFAFLYFILK